MISWQNFVLLLTNIGLVVSGQTLIKQGVNKIGDFRAMPFFDFIIKSFTSFPIIGGIFLYVVSTVIWLMLLSRINLSVAYPGLSIGYLIILIISWFYLKEAITSYQIIGVTLIVSGIFFIYALK